MKSLFEATDISAESPAHAQGLSSNQLSPFTVRTDTRGHYYSPGSRKFKSSYEKALCLQRKMTLGLNILLESVSAYVAVTGGIPDDVPSNVVTLQEVDELSYGWAIARDSVRAALVTLTSEPANRLYYRSAPLDLTRGRSRIRRSMTNLVCFL